MDVVRDHASTVSHTHAVAPDQNISEGRVDPDTPNGDALADVIFNIGETYKLRVAYVRAMTKLTNQMKAMLRRWCDGDKDAANKLYKKITAGKVELETGQKYAYGFEERIEDGKRVVGHGGGAPGMNCDLRMHWDTGYTIIVMSNSSPPIARQVSRWIDERLPR